MKKIQTTKNLILREMTTRDIPNITALIKEDNKELSLWTTIPFPITKKKVQNFYKETKKKKNEKIYVIRSKVKKEVMGVIHPTKKAINNCVNIGYWIGLDFRNKGYMTEAVKSVIKEAFKDRSVQRVEITASEKNIPSQTVIKKSRLQYEGTQRMAAFNGFKQYGNLKVYSITRKDVEGKTT